MRLTSGNLTSSSVMQTTDVGNSDPLTAGSPSVEKTENIRLVTTLVVGSILESWRELVGQYRGNIHLAVAKVFGEDRPEEPMLTVLLEITPQITRETIRIVDGLPPADRLLQLNQVIRTVASQALIPLRTLLDKSSQTLV